MKEQIQKKLSDSKAARWTALLIVSFTMMCGYFLTDVMSPLENLLTTKGKIVYFADDTSMPADSLIARVKMFAVANSLSTPSLTEEKLQVGAEYQYMESVDGQTVVVNKKVNSIASGEGWNLSLIHISEPTRPY